MPIDEQEKNRRKRSRFLESKPVIGPTNAKDRLLSFREVSAMMRCKLWTVRDKARLNLHITRTDTKSYVWLSQAVLIDWPKTLTNAQAHAMLDRSRKPKKRRRGSDPRLRLKNKSTIRKFRAIEKATGELPPMAGDYEHRSLAMLDMWLSDYRATLA